MLADLMRMNGGKSKVTYDVQDATVVAEPYDTSGNGGRKLVRLDNGWLVAVTKITGYFYFYVSKNNGATFEQLCFMYITGIRDNDISIVSSGTKIYTLFGYSTSHIMNVRFDATAVSSSDNVYSSNRRNIITTETALGNVSLAINPQGTELHAAWSSKNATYPNSFNIRYTKGTINVDGSVTWGAVEQRSNLNTTGLFVQNPTVTIDNSGNARIIAEMYNGSSYSIRRINAIGNTGIIYNGGTYAQSSPSAIFVPTEINGLPQGRIWVAWHGNDVSFPNGNNRVRVSYSDDGGVNWTLLESNLGYSTNKAEYPSITCNKDNDVFIVYRSIANYAYHIARKLSTDTNFNHTYRIVSYGKDSPATVYPSTLEDVSLDFTSPLLITQIGESADITARVGFSGTWTE